MFPLFPLSGAPTSACQPSGPIHPAAAPQHRPPDCSAEAGPDQATEVCSPKAPQHGITQVLPGVQSWGSPPASLKPKMEEGQVS